MAASISSATYYHRGIHLLQILLKALELVFNNFVWDEMEQTDLKGMVMDSTKNLVQSQPSPQAFVVQSNPTVSCDVTERLAKNTYM